MVNFVLCVFYHNSLKNGSSARWSIDIRKKVYILFICVILSIYFYFLYVIYIQNSFLQMCMIYKQMYIWSGCILKYQNEQ